MEVNIHLVANVCPGANAPFFLAFFFSRDRRSPQGPSPDIH